jgi:drug/metabolite transporter (DMT)-like permease
MSVRYLILLLALGTVWGSSYLFIKVIVEETSPLALVEGRLLFGTVTIAAVLAWRRASLNLSPGLLLKVTLLAILANIIPFLLISWGEIHISSSVAAILNSSFPLFTAVFAAALPTGERLTPLRLGGLVVGFLGVMVLTGTDILDITKDSVLGQLAVIAASACYGLGAIYTRSLLRSQDFLSLSGLQIALGALVLAPALFVLEGGRPDSSLSLEAGGSLVTLGILSTGLATVVYLHLIGSIGSVRASLVGYIMPITGLLLGWAVLGEPLGLNSVLGCALILIGVAAVGRGRGETSAAAAAPSESNSSSLPARQRAGPH